MNYEKRLTLEEVEAVAEMLRNGEDFAIVAKSMGRNKKRLLSVLNSRGFSVTGERIKAQPMRRNKYLPMCKHLIRNMDETGYTLKEISEFSDIAYEKVEDLYIEYKRSGNI